MPSWSGTQPYALYGGPGDDDIPTGGEGKNASSRTSARSSKGCESSPERRATTASDLEGRRRELSKRLATRQAKKDRYVRTYAQGHISEEELENYLADLKNQTDDLRVLLTSVEAELSQKHEQAEVADTTEAWLLALRERVEDVEGDSEGRSGRAGGS